MLYPLRYEGGTVTLPSTLHAPLAGWRPGIKKHCVRVSDFGQELDRSGRSMSSTLTVVDRAHVGT